MDTFADMAAFPVDLLRADYTSAGLDVFGILPFVGEIADTAKLARAGIKVADTAHDAGKVIDFGEVIGKYVDEITGEAYDTTIATVHYSQDGFHIIPAAPKEWRR